MNRPLIDDAEGEGEYVVAINGRRCVVWTPADWAAQRAWEVATIRPLAVIKRPVGRRRRGSAADLAGPGRQRPGRSTGNVTRSYAPQPESISDTQIRNRVLFPLSYTGGAPRENRNSPRPGDMAGLTDQLSCGAWLRRLGSNQHLTD